MLPGGLARAIGQIAQQFVLLVTIGVIQHAMNLDPIILIGAIQQIGLRERGER